MNTTAHSNPEDVMAYLDGELSLSDAQALSTHLDHCVECSTLAEQFRNTSEALSRWTIPVIPLQLEESINTMVAVTGTPHIKPHYPNLFQTTFLGWKLWSLGGGAVALLLMLVLFLPTRPRPSALRTYIAPDENADSHRQPPPVEMLDKQKSETTSSAVVADNLLAARAMPAPPPPPPPNAKPEAPTQSASFSQPTAAPMIARTVSLAIMVKDVDATRAHLEAILAEHHGYAAQLTASTPENAPRSLQASLRIPAPELNAALTNLRALGRVENESQSGEEVTQQHADLVARLKNSHETEERFEAILQQRTGKVSDVLEVEQEIERVRGEIETMEAEQKILDHRVDFATIDIQLTEEYKAQLHSPADSVSTRMHNAFVAGYEHVTETLLGLALFLEEYGPAILIWLAILSVPAIFLRRRYRRLRSTL